MTVDLFEAQPSLDSEPRAIDVDANVVAQLPAGTTVLVASGHGASNWTRTARVDTRLSNGDEKSYFLKVAAGDLGRGMMFGEYESMVAIYKIVPNFVPKPTAWGTFESNKDLHFFLCDFHEMDLDLPNVNKFTARLAELHRKSTSPNGKWGFHIMTYNGTLPQLNDWTDTWEEYFTSNFKHFLEMEKEVQGPATEELAELSRAMLEKVIPRLLRPMETRGRHIEPSLIHGDMWYGNAATDVAIDEPIVFDASAFYGHNEYDVRTMRPDVRFKFGRKYLKTYHAHYPIAEPEEDHADRNILYACRSHLHDSCLFPNNPKPRNSLIKMMKELVDKYPEGYEGFRDKAHSAEEAVAGSNDKPSAEHKEFETDEFTSKVKSIAI